MTDQIRQFVHAKPFRPFVIVMTNGQEVRVDSPDHIAFTERQVAYVNEDGSFSVASMTRVDRVYQDTMLAYEAV